MKTLLLTAAATIVLAATAQAQAPAADTQALTQRLNQLMRDARHPDGEQRVSLNNCSVTQIVRKYRKSGETSTANVSVSNSKNGSSWGVKSNDKVELELKLGLEWSEIGSVMYAPMRDKEDGREYYEVTFLRRPPAKGETKGLDEVSLALYTQNEVEVKELVRRLGEARRRCTGTKI